MLLNQIKRYVLGNPLATQAQEHQRLDVARALPVFASDALSSVAYATEEILLILAGVSAAAALWGVPIAICIVALLLIVSASYRQTIERYPNGGGAYTVSMANLGERAGLTAGGALMLDYILTVAVSISAGTAAIRSAIPWVAEHQVLFAVILITLMTLANLRGLKESSVIFAVPTYFFMGMMFLLLGFGAFRVLTHDPLTETGLTDYDVDAAKNISIFLLLKAFSSGCAALTGIEAISNGVPVFQKPEVRNAKRTMTIMVLLLGLFFLGVSYFARHYHVLPTENETVLSQIGRLVFQNKFLYLCMQGATAAILCLAANTAYADFPRLASIMALDRYLPRQLHNLGDRLVYSNGIVSLGVTSILLVILFSANTHSLVPLYSVGVFLSFTLSQTGMIVHHLRHKEEHWKKGLALNLTGAVCTFVVLLVVSVTKFTSGAWFTLVVIPALVIAFKSIKAHYQSVARQLSLSGPWQLDTARRPAVAIIPVSGFHSGVLQALDTARSQSGDVRLLVVDLEAHATASIRRAFEERLGRIPGLSLVVLDSPFRSLVQPVVDYVQNVKAASPQSTVSVYVPQFIPKRWWHNFLHNQSAFFLKTRLRFVQGLTITNIYYHLND
jgi:amino acid transporter